VRLGAQLLLLSCLTPIAVALRFGSTYGFAAQLVLVGAFLYVLNVALIHRYLTRRAPEMLRDGTWELTAGTGIVPRWVSALGVLGTGFVPAGAVIALLLWLGVVTNRG
jgi:hypothetical protein